MRLHADSIDKVVECTRSSVRNLVEEHSKYVIKLENQYNSTIDKLTAEISSKSAQIKSLQKEKNELGNLLRQRDSRIADLTEMDKTEASCIEMNRMLSKLNAYITEAESEQLKQVVTLNNISSIMTIAEILGKSPVTVDNEIQTNWAVEKSVFPELECPIVFSHPFAKIKSSVHPRQSEILDIHMLCQSVLEKSTGENEYCYELLFDSIQRFSSLKDISTSVLEIVHNLRPQTDIKSLFYLRMIGLPNRISLRCQSLICKMASLMKDQNDIYLSIYYLNEFLQTYLSSKRSSGETILSKITYVCPESFEPLNINKSMLILLCRLQISVEIQGKPIRSLIDLENSN